MVILLVDTRLREDEKKAAVAGAVSGGAVAVGTALIVEGIKQFVRGGGLLVLSGMLLMAWNVWQTYRHAGDAADQPLLPPDASDARA